MSMLRQLYDLHSLILAESFCRAANHDRDDPAHQRLILLRVPTELMLSFSPNLEQLVI